MLTEAEVETLLASLIPHYESASLEALDARDEYLAIGATRPNDVEAILSARRRWEACEQARDAIRQSLDELAERQAA
jgi:hypothetical protein